MELMLLLLLIPYLFPGLVLARGMYSEQVKEIRSGDHGPVVPPKPPRPRITLAEQLHVAGPANKRCHVLSSTTGKTCNCSYREEYLDIKNGWIDYDEWISKYGHIRNPSDKQRTPNMTPIYMAIPFWPLAGMAMYVKGGAKNIPDYRAIERLERLNELEVGE